MMERTAIIMAGGHGERFWPKSRKNMPKQFLSLTDDGKTMIQLSVERIQPIVNIENIFVVTNIDYIDIVSNQLPGLPRKNILAEPDSKNTAPCIALASAVIAALYEDAICFVLASDHIIDDKEQFIDTLNEAAQIAEGTNSIVTIGITPDHAETGYGYIHYSTDNVLAFSDSYKVSEFVEKPDLITAQKYIEDGKYLWNSGMFVWRLQTILMNFEKSMPTLYQSILTIKKTVNTSEFLDTINSEYKSYKSESIDYGIMEKADNIYTIRGDFGWDDVGGWLALERVNKTDIKGNFFKGLVTDLDTKNCTVITDNKLVATVGVSNLVVVVEGDSILICNKDNTQDIKKIVSILKSENLDCYL